MNHIAIQLIAELAKHKNEAKAKWLENYVKHDIKSYGVGIPEIRNIVQVFERSYQLNQQEVSQQVSLLDELAGDGYTEPKLAAILYIQLFWQTNKPVETLQVVSDWFDRGWIADWNVCDWLCVRLLSPLLDKEPELTIAELAKWNSSPHLWKARASLVPFAQCKDIGKHSNTIAKFSEVLIRREERFCKTAVGWVLREYSKINKKFVIDFLEHHKAFTTMEVIKNATKYL